VGGCRAGSARDRAPGRVGKHRSFNLLWLLPIGFVLLLAAVAAAKGLRNNLGVAPFIADHPGTITSAVGDRSRERGVLPKMALGEHGWHRHRCG